MSNFHPPRRRSSALNLEFLVFWQTGILAHALRYLKAFTQ